MGAIADCCCCCMQLSDAPNWCIANMDVQFNWTNVVQTTIGNQDRVYAQRDCCIEKTFRYQSIQPQVDTLGDEYFRDNYRFETLRDIYAPSRASNLDCPTWPIVAQERWVTQQIHRRVAVVRSRLRDFIRVRIGKKELPCRENQCRFVVSIYVDIDIQGGYIEQQWFRREFTRTGTNPATSVEETGNPTTWSAFVATTANTRQTIVYVKEFETLPETFAFNSSDDWACVQSACNSDAPRQACATVTPDFTANPNPTNVYIANNDLCLFIQGLGLFCPTWTNPNTGQVCQPPVQSQLVYTIIAPLNRVIDLHSNGTVGNERFSKVVSYSIETDFFANSTSACVSDPTVSVSQCLSLLSNPLWFLGPGEGNFNTTGLQSELGI